MFSFRIHQQQRMISVNHNHFPAVEPLDASREKKTREMTILVHFHKPKTTFVH
jgi:hypothetical protein